jgi:hypothetical protein
MRITSMCDTPLIVWYAYTGDFKECGSSAFRAEEENLTFQTLVLDHSHYIFAIYMCKFKLW